MRILVPALLVALLASAAAVYFVTGTDEEQTALCQLTARRPIRAGTPGELVIEAQRGLYSTCLLVRERQEAVVYDWEYLRGRVAVVDIFPGAALQKSDFRP